MHVVLGSASPRRKEILSKIISIDSFEIPDIDESQMKGEQPHDYSRRMAMEKNQVINPDTSIKEQLIITSDTLVAINKRVIGKPASKKDAINMLMDLSDLTHEVMSSICIHYYSDVASRIICEVEKSKVQFKSIDISLIEQYISRVNVYDKAGSYAIQEYGEMIIKKIDGSLTNIIGFPLRLFFRIMVDLQLEKSFLL